MSRVIEDLITRRARIKELLKKNKNDILLYARSIALKYLANSFYGYLIFDMARWYCFECGDATTAFGRQYVKNVMQSAKEDGFEVLYGDTDSAMLLLGDKTRKDAFDFAEKINKNLPGLMELELESFYPRGVFVAIKGTDIGAKKKYAMISDNGEIKIRGFEMIRRNWSPIAKDTQKEVLSIVLKEGDAAKAVRHVNETVELLRRNAVPISKVLIHTQLQKPVEDYVVVSPHVAAAKRMKQKGITVAPGQVIEYVIVRGDGLIRDKVRLGSEIEQEDYDSEYYINNQVLPAVESVLLTLGFDIKKSINQRGQSTLGDF